MSKIDKLGVGIVAFDDVTHLKNMCSELRDLVDVFVICLQDKSYFGNPIDSNIISYVESLKNENIIDDVIWFVGKDYGNAPEAPRLTETDKRNYIIEYLKNHHGCTHCLITDSDEFYDHDEFKNAKEKYNQSEAVASYCQYVNYYRDYQHVMVWPYKSYVPFITETKYGFDFKKGNFRLPSDPTRRYVLNENDKYIVFPFSVVKMHHLSWIRTNIECKIDNWSSKRYFENIKGLRDRIIERYNNYTNGQNAIIMFGTPDNEVIVNVLPKQYINPKYPLTEI
jgi:hypothetical protein